MRGSPLVVNRVLAGILFIECVGGSKTEAVLVSIAFFRNWIQAAMVKAEKVSPKDHVIKYENVTNFDMN